ncbi:MAG TPA: RnfH family protein [Rhodanobacteraceae bacterium]
MVEDGIDIEVVYARTGHVWSCRLHVPAGTTVLAAVERSRLAFELPEVHVDADCLGVFGRRVRPDHLLRDGDRVEIYRPLTLDPMEARRRRASRNNR